MDGEFVIAKPLIYAVVGTKQIGKKKETYNRRHLLRIRLKHPQLVSQIHARTIQDHVQNRMRRTRVVAQLIREPHPLRCGVAKVGWAVCVSAPHEAEDEAAGGEVVCCPWFDVVEFDEL
jgi:hypothetical protein